MARKAKVAEVIKEEPPIEEEVKATSNIVETAPQKAEPEIRIIQAKPMRTTGTLQQPAIQHTSDNVFLVNNTTGKRTWMARGAAMRQVKKYPTIYSIA